MHFTTLFILSGENLENTSAQQIEDLFCDNFCYCCGETHPKYQSWCDWFQIGGRWCDILKAKKGIHCVRGWSNDNAPIENDKFSIVNISDLTGKLPRNQIYAVATRSRIYLENDEWQGGDVNPTKFHQLLDMIDNKQLNGVIALIDCHD